MIERLVFPSPVSFSKKRKESFMTRERVLSEREKRDGAILAWGFNIYTVFQKTTATIKSTKIGFFFLF